MTALFPCCSATLLPSIKRFLPKEWNDNLIVWWAPFIHCMNLTHFDARSCLALFDYIFNAAVIKIKTVATESRYTNLLCGLNDFELFHYWCFQPCYKQNDIAPCGYGHLKNYIICWHRYMEAPFSLWNRCIILLCARVAALYNIYSWRWFKSMSFLFQHSRWSSQSHRLLLLCRDFSFACGMHLRSIGWQIMFWESLSVFRFVCMI